MQTAFERLIAKIPTTASVMDVGYAGLDGENTTNYLRAHFGKVNGLCKDVDAVARYKTIGGYKTDSVTIGMYPQDFPPYKFDLLVLDPNIDSNLELWSNKGLLKASSFINEGGALLTYILTTDEYGDAETSASIRAHRDEWWYGDWNLEIRAKRLAHLPAASGLTWWAEEREERRPEIFWVLLKKK